MTRDELLALARDRVTVDIVTAGRAFGASRMTSYRLAAAGKFPVPLILVGKKFAVPTSAIVAKLGLADASEEDQAA